MHYLLEKLMRKRKVEVHELDTFETQQFATWSSALGEEITVEGLTEYCTKQIRLIESKWGDMDNKKIKNERLVIAHVIFTKIHRMLTEDDPERKEAEQEIQRLLDSDDPPDL